MLEVQASLTLDFALDLSASDRGGHGHRARPQMVQLQRSDASLGQLINAQQVAELPLNGRNFVQLALLGPGTVTGRAGSFLAQGPSSEVSYRGSMSVSAQGMRENANDWLYDGVDDNELTAGGVGILPNIDSIREFKVLTHNYLAQYGSRGGTTVLVSSKSGENSFHGYGCSSSSATTRSTPATSSTARQKRPWNQNTYGGSLGGPIKRDKTFFFAGFQGNNIDEGLTTLLTVPTALMHQGIFTESFAGAPAADHLRPGDDPRSIRRPASSSAIHSRTTRSRPTASTRSARRCSNLLPHARPSPIGSAATTWPTRSRRWTTTRATSASITTSATTIGSSAASASRRPTSTCRPACRISARTGGFASNQTFKTRRP